jgi:SAM-dependent methyltransferase
MSDALSHPVTSCQICGGTRLRSLLFLAYVAPVNTMAKVGTRAEEQPTFPLEWLRCEDCSLVQIGTEVRPDVLFPPSYPYRSGTTRILRDNFAELCREASPMIGLGPQDLVVDIGSNDGTLLSNFHQAGHKVLGIEPSGAGDVANEKGIRTWIAFFGRETAKKARAEFGAAKLITAANVFAHMGDVHGVVDGILELLSPDGVFISENHYLGDLVRTLQYDTIYHEHLRYYSIGSLQQLFDRHGMEIFHVRRIPTHGGSVRVYSARKGQRPIDPSVAAFLDEERAQGLMDGSAFVDFRRRVMQSKLDLHALLQPIKQAGGRVYGIGAPSRASTLINYVGLDDMLLDCVVEVPGSDKLNKYIPSTRVPVLEEAKLFADQPEYALFLSWHIGEELAPKLREKGFKGKFIVPLPVPRILEV